MGINVRWKWKNAIKHAVKTSENLRLSVKLLSKTVWKMYKTHLAANSDPKITPLNKKQTKNIKNKPLG